jgi:hypothetical protein
MLITQEQPNTDSGLQDAPHTEYLVTRAHMTTAHNVTAPSRNHAQVRGRDGAEREDDCQAARTRRPSVTQGYAKRAKPPMQATSSPCNRPVLRILQRPGGRRERAGRTRRGSLRNPLPNGAPPAPPPPLPRRRCVVCTTQPSRAAEPAPPLTQPLPEQRCVVCTTQPCRTAELDVSVPRRVHQHPPTAAHRTANAPHTDSTVAKTITASKLVPLHNASAL